ncbi:MAG: hypothetical protein DRJ67_07520 [Thermoprotei archaeon]|nr:MAG: hypothetical protein DRJ67_07520 [Thermoprotei archaeon]
MDVMSVLGAGAAGLMLGVAVRKAAGLLAAAAGLFLLGLFVLETQGLITVNWDAIMQMMNDLVNKITEDFVGYLREHGVSLGAFIIGLVIGAKL